MLGISCVRKTLTTTESLSKAVECVDNHHFIQDNLAFRLAQFFTNGSGRRRKTRNGATMKRLEVLLVTLLLSTIASAQPALKVGTREVIAAGLTPGQPSYWLGLGRSFRSARPILLRWDEVIVADAEGKAVLAVPYGVPPVSVWCVVDGGTGTVGVASPSDSAWPRSFGEESRPINEADGKTVGVDLPSREITVLFVRPGVGAWHRLVFDGGSGDQDAAANTRISLAFSDLEAVGTEGKAPTHGQPLDSVLSVDPETFRYWVWKQPAAAGLQGGER